MDSMSNAHMHCINKVVTHALVFYVPGFMSYAAIAIHLLVNLKLVSS
jgi:hypothetical protein